MRRNCFRELDPHRWSQLNHSPVAMLKEYPLAKLEARAAELGLHSRVNYAYRRLREYMEGGAYLGSAAGGRAATAAGGVFLG